MAQWCAWHERSGAWMADPWDPLDRPVGRLLRLAQEADPQQVVETLSLTVAELGGV